MERLKPPDAVVRYFDASGTYYLLLQTFTSAHGWVPAKGAVWARQITKEMCCELAEAGVTAVQVIGHCAPDRVARADFQMSELIDELDRLAHGSCTTC